MLLEKLRQDKGLGRLGRETLLDARDALTVICRDL